MPQRGKSLPLIRLLLITPANDQMVAMSMADGFARRSGRPQAVIVHVDVGTQGLGAAVHNASTGRAPVFIFAGLSPFTLDGEHRGSRTEYIHWIQDVPDQKAIVAQYCRYAGEVKSGHNVKQMVNRALQFAKSDPQGPVYLCGAREIMEADITPYTLTQEHWHPIQLAGIPDSEAAKIADALGKADRPLVITGYAGRNHQVPASLVKLANLVPGLQVLDSGGSDMCFPADHPAWLGLRYGVDQAVTKADVIVVIDCDTPWIPTRCRPRDDAVIYHIDVDPLKQQMPTFYIPALARYRADAKTAIDQIIARLPAQACESPQESPAGTRRRAEYAALLDKIESTAREETASGGFGTGHLCKTLKRLLPADSIYAVEAVTNAPIVMNNIRPTIPGSWINCGGGGLGWSGGGAMGIKLAAEEEGASGSKFIVQIVGDGTFLFSVPGSVYWIARRYNIPVLTIILNNKGKSVYLASKAVLADVQAGTPLASRWSSFTPPASVQRLPTRKSTFLSIPRPTTLELPRPLPVAIFSRQGSIKRMPWKPS